MYEVDFTGFKEDAREAASLLGSISRLRQNRDLVWGMFYGRRMEWRPDDTLDSCLARYTLEAHTLPKAKRDAIEVLKKAHDNKDWGAALDAIKAYTLEGLVADRNTAEIQAHADKVVAENTHLRHTIHRMCDAMGWTSQIDPIDDAESLVGGAKNLRLLLTDAQRRLGKT